MDDSSVFGSLREELINGGRGEVVGRVTGPPAEWEEDYRSGKQRFIGSLKVMLSEQNSLREVPQGDAEFIRNFIITRDKIVYHATQAIRYAVGNMRRGEREDRAERSLAIFKSRYPELTTLIAKFERTLDVQKQVAHNVIEKIKSDVSYEVGLAMSLIPILRYSLIKSEIDQLELDPSSIFTPKDFWSDSNKVNIVVKRVEVVDSKSENILDVRYNLYIRSKEDNLRLVYSAGSDITDDLSYYFERIGVDLPKQLSVEHSYETIKRIIKVSSSKEYGSVPDYQHEPKNPMNKNESGEDPEDYSQYFSIMGDYEQQCRESGTTSSLEGFQKYLRSKSRRI